jgi:hypothetical protein
MEKTWKHNEWVKALKTPCPPENYVGRETNGYRWVFEPIADERNFLPQYFKVENYQLAKDESVVCQSLGLSFFDTSANAARKFEQLKARYGKFVYQRTGTHLAEVKLGKGHGVSDTPNIAGHFTFHPFEDADLEATATIVQQL